MPTKLDRIDPQALQGNNRATLTAWRKYEQLVIAAYKNHPKAYVYRPTSMTAATVASRLRDAVRGKLAFDYPSEVSTFELAKWYAEVVIKHDHEHVYIGPPEDIQQVLQPTGNASAATDSLTFPTLSFEEVSAFTLLISNGRITAPVVIVQPPDLTLLPPRPNVQMMERPDGSLLIL